ncbi:ATP-dependent endonuclease [Virgibacillus kekensis]|uniref:ATP-dependent endonuclease n=1 Tax=Virgibacillus kekensis TaxID=202261 RepID=A0ABV9DHM1_9BACI
MYIQSLTVENFRSFRSSMTVEFNDGLNVMIGHNNAGKTTIIRALEILFNSKKNKQLSVDDFNKRISIDELYTKPPTITLQAVLRESQNEDSYSDDLVTVSSWLTRLESPYEATITYEYYLPDKEWDNYYQAIKEINSSNPNDFWNEIEHNFLRKYKSRLLVGHPGNKTAVEPEDIDKFDFQFLTAIRDVERDLYTGRNALLKEVIDFFIDYDIKGDTSIEDKEKLSKIRENKIQFSDNANELIKSLHDRMEEGKGHMLRYVQNTGAGFGEMTPAFDGSINDTELYSALRLIVQDETGITLPAVNNGLGYNNLIYISLLLAKMQKDTSDEYLGSNSKVYSILAIEEPEAHLHPNMQYKFLKFLKENRESEVRQIFITSHSPNITAAVDLDDVIVLYKDINKEMNVAYPGRVFDESDTEDLKSKKYVQRFLDVTKADIFFAQNVMLVEGLAEQLLVPEFAKALNPDSDLVENHTSVINIGGRYFDHFLKLFDTHKSDYAINKKVVCVTDLDPVRKRKDGDDWEACLPLFLNLNESDYDYKNTSNDLVGKQISENIYISTQNRNESCTLEYDIALHNLTNETIVVSSMSNKKEIISLVEDYNDGKNFSDLVSIIRKSKYKEEAENVKINKKNEDWFKKHLIAGRYLKSINKGEAAQELALAISEDLEKQNSNIKCPEYLKKAITWLNK